MRKKSLTKLMSGLLIGSIVLAGCGNSAGNNTMSGNNGSEGNNGEKVTLNLYTWINEENGNWEKTVAAYEEANPDVKVKVNTLVENMSADDYLKKLDLLAASGDKLDLLMFSNSEDLAKRISAGMIEPINSYMDSEGINVEELYNMGPAPAGNDGSYYALPTKHNTYLIMMNKDHLDAAGLSIPTDWTWDDYR